VEFLSKILSEFNNFLYTYILIALLIISGIYFTCKTKFAQIKLLPDAIKYLSHHENKNSKSSFQALMISTASRVGVGNMAGVTVALVTGGPGAVLWMWIMAVFGASSALIESTLAQIYKEKHEDRFRGGPSYYIQKALNARWLGIIFAILLIICFAYGFNGLQSYNISSSFDYYFKKEDQWLWHIIIGIFLALITGACIFGGVNRIGVVSSFVVPIMAIGYLTIGLFITVKNFNRIPETFSNIFKNAFEFNFKTFDFQAIIGGITGSAMFLGIKRGLFSNEAGMGSSPVAAATASTPHPISHGMVQVISVYIDTLVICTTSAFIVLLSGEDLKNGLNGIPFLQKAISGQIGSIGTHLIVACTFIFAFTSIIGNYCYAESSLLFIKNNKVLLFFFRISCMAAVFLGALSDLTTVWDIADISMGLMAFVNIIVMFIIGKYAILALKDYNKQRKFTSNFTFKAKNINLYNTDEWK